MRSCGWCDDFQSTQEPLAWHVISPYFNPVLNSTKWYEIWNVMRVWNGRHFGQKNSNNNNNNNSLQNNTTLRSLPIIYCRKPFKDWNIPGCHGSRRLLPDFFHISRLSGDFAWWTRVREFTIENSQINLLNYQLPLVVEATNDQRNSQFGEPHL